MSGSLRPHGLSPVNPLSMGFARQEYWSGLPFLFPWDIPDSGIERWSPALQTASLLIEPPYFNINSGFIQVLRLLKEFTFRNV